MKKLIRWLARAEIARLGAELAQIKATAERAINLAYANGYHVGRSVGQGEMLAHLRGDPVERPTTEIVSSRASAMVH